MIFLCLSGHHHIPYTWELLSINVMILIEQWRKEYNQVRPHSAMNNRPPAPDAILTMTTT